MFGNFQQLEHLDPKELDEYLEKGWFRMGQNIFTCNFLNFNQKFYSSIWLRINIYNSLSNNKLQKLKKLNKKFNVVVRKAFIDEEKENLFSKYKYSKPFETSESLNSLLLNNQDNNVFNSYEVCIYDQLKLIAVGYFDLGDKSAMGIVSVYDPEYQKYSLGKYLIHNKIEFCQSLNMEYFYPGYFAPGYKTFDYKLDIDIDNLEYLDFITNEWKSIQEYKEEYTPYNIISQHLDYIELLLFSRLIPFNRFQYKFYNVNSISENLFPKRDTFDFPEFIFIYHTNFKDFTPTIVFNPKTCEYLLIKCLGYYHMPHIQLEKNEYGTFILNTSEILYLSKNAFEMINFILTYPIESELKEN